MELYILDDKLRRVEVFDQYESLVWAERFQEPGDFQMTIGSTYATKSMFVPGAWVATDVSNRVMVVQSAVDRVDDKGRKFINVQGVSFESFMDNRPTLQAFPNSSGAANLWTITDKPADAIREIFRLKCRDNTTPASDNFPFMATGNLYPPDTIPEPSTTYVYQIESDTVLNVIRDLCKVYDLGYRITRNGDKSQLFFNIYSGNDRTTSQTLFDAVIFAPELDNLQDTSTLQSNADEKNVAFVYAKNGTQVVYGPNGNSSQTGFDRKVLVVDASDVDLPAGMDLNRVLAQRGQAELSKHIAISGFDGEIPQTNSYIYDVHYQLGDLCEMRSGQGVTNVMRVTEQIFSQDASGFKSYPTLSVNQIITPGTWASWDLIAEWTNATGEWADQ